MKYVVRHFDGGFQVVEMESGQETLIASFHKDPLMKTGQKSLAQKRAEKYCEILNQSDLEKNTTLDFD
jgi:hypothetical protein